MRKKQTVNIAKKAKIKNLSAHHSMMAASAQGDNWIYLNISLFVSQNDHLAVKNKQREMQLVIMN